jgi:hypothetical protein
MDIPSRFRIGADIFYVPVAVPVKGLTYVKAYGYYKKPWKEWAKIRFIDKEIVGMVNLKFISEHYGYAPEEIIKMRAGSKSFIVINKEIKVKKVKAGHKGKAKSDNRLLVSYPAFRLQMRKLKFAATKSCQ